MTEEQLQDLLETYRQEAFSDILALDRWGLFAPEYRHQQENLFDGY
jgi:hypothetical protein